MIGISLLVGGHHLVSSISRNGRNALELSQLQQLQLLQQMRRHSILTARDWAHWDETLRYVRGSNPNFLRTSNLDGTHLFDDGAVLAIFDRNGQRLTLQSHKGAAALWDAALQGCLAGLHAARQLQGQTQRDGLCRGTSGDYIGSAVEVTDNARHERSGACRTSCT